MSDSPAAPAATPAASSSSAPSSPSAPASKPAATAAPAGASPSAPVGGAAPALPHQDADAPAGGNDHPDAQPGETKAETIQRIKLKLKVNGKEDEREFSTEELQLLAQKGLGADEKFSEAANIRKAFQAFKSMLDGDDVFAAFEDSAFGGSQKIREKVIQQLAREFQAEELKKQDPRAYELQKLQEENQRFKQAEERRQAAERERAQREADEKAWAEMKKSWTAALQSSGFSENEALIRRMAMIGQGYLEKGMDLAPNLLVAELKNQLSAENRLLMGGLKGEQLISFLGPDIVKEVAAYQLAQAQKGKVVQEPLKAPETENTPKKGSENDKFERPLNLLRSFKDFRDGK